MNGPQHYAEAEDALRLAATALNDRQAGMSVPDLAEWLDVASNGQAVRRG